MPNYQTITVDITPGAKEKPVLNASQFDNGRPFAVALTWEGVSFTDAGDFDIEIHVKKPDGNIVTAEPDSVVNDVCLFHTTEQMCACHGNNECEIVLFANAVQIGTGNFILDVEKAPDEGGIQSASEIHNLTQQIAQIVPEVLGDDYYNKTQTDALLANKADISDLPDMTNYYDKSQTNTLLAAKADTSSLASVAFSGDYNDLINKPTIPAAQIQSDYAQDDNTKVDYIKNKPDIAGMIADAIDNILPVVSNSGAIATINVDLERALKSITVEPLATQVVRCGVNFTTANDTTTSEAGYIVGAGFPEYVNTDETVLPSSTYTASFTTANAAYPCAAQIVFYDSNGTSVGTDVVSINSAGRVSISITANANFNRWQIFCNSPTGGAFSDFQIEVGSTAHDYADYNGNVYPVTDIANITTLNGINNIYADAGDVSVSAYDSIQHYIDNQ